MRIKILGILLSLWPVVSVAADTDNQLFQRIFTNWTAAFNHKQLAPACDLFAKTVAADYAGQPTKNYANICDGFKKIFKQHDRTYQYAFKLHQVYRSADFAAVRVTWYLRVYQNGKHIESVQDEGLDIFKQNANGEWKIVYYLAYPSKDKPGE